MAVHAFLTVWLCRLVVQEGKSEREAELRAELAELIEQADTEAANL